MIILFVYKLIIRKDEPEIGFKFLYILVLPLIMSFFTFGKKNCKNNSQAYQDGYRMGVISKGLRDYSGPNENLAKLNANGIYPQVANGDDRDCYCIGYNAGFDNDPSEFPEKEN